MANRVYKKMCKMNDCSECVIVIENSIEEVRETKLPVVEGRLAVIVLTEYKKGKGIYGVQFWTRAMINEGVNKNTDGTESRFVEQL